MQLDLMCLPLWCTESIQTEEVVDGFYQLQIDVVNGFKKRNIDYDHEITRWFVDLKNIISTLSETMMKIEGIAPSADTEARIQCYQGMRKILFILVQHLSGDSNKINLFYMLCDINDSFPHIDIVDIVELTKKHAKITPTRYYSSKLLKLVC